MIITVTMNPAIDKTVDLDAFVHGGLNRLKNIISDAGGKGINVSKTIQALGGNTVATGFVGGSAGKFIEKVLNNQGIKADFVVIGDETRTNLKVVEKNGYVTELNEPGPVIKEAELNELVEKLVGYANEEALFILAGSIPSGIDKNIYQILIEQVKSRGATVFLDADGELFVHALEAKPDIVKPNRVELEEYFNLDDRASETELVEMGKKLIEKGIGTVIISMGQTGALFLTQEAIVKVPGLKVNAHSTVGAGDAMVAAVAYGIDQNMNFNEWVKLGVATSAGAVTTLGTKPPTLSLVKQLVTEVEIINII